MRADFHLHTTASDGSKSPAEIISWAKAAGIDAAAITDHDSVSGIDEAVREGERLGVKVVPGIELSTYSNIEIHVLGYNIDYLNPAFCEELEIIKSYRRERNKLIGEKLKGLRINLDMDFTADGVGRMNIARQMVSEKYARDVNDAFERYLGSNRPAYCAARRLTPLEAVKLIRRFGGLSSLAHPKKYYSDGRLEILLSGLKKFGLDGLEVFYPGHTDADKAALSALAAKYRLVCTGGSDYHGDEERELAYFPDARTVSALKLK